MAAILAAFGLLSYSLWGQEERRQSGVENGGILYGSGYGFILAALLGWVLDDLSGKARGSRSGRPVS
jgi:hypothetical protein